MSVLRNKKGILMFETLLLIQLLVFVFFCGHVQIVKLWRKKIEKLQKERIAYDGEQAWIN